MRCPFGGWVPGSAQWEGVVGEKKRKKEDEEAAEDEDGRGKLEE